MYNAQYDLNVTWIFALSLEANGILHASTLSHLPNIATLGRMTKY